ncbi:MAG: hypothetical protein DWG76_03200 [Chloroflexi bacterium]|nr:hypothetical protein [Chloroflexota bacterium]
MSEAVLYCANHPDRETGLRCNRCEKPVCASCAIQTPTGYRCEECVRGQQKVFITAKPLDYVFAFPVAAALSYVGATLARLVTSFGFLGIFILILLAPVAGGIIAEAVRTVTGRRRAPGLYRLSTVAVVVGGLPLLLSPLLFVFSGGGFTAIFAVIWPALYLSVSASAFYSRLTGISVKR